VSGSEPDNGPSVKLCVLCGELSRTTGRATMLSAIIWPVTCAVAAG